VPDVQLQPSKTRHHHHHRKDESKDKDRSRKVLYVATAIYAFSGTSSGDLSLHAGDVLEITKEVNADWLKGKNVITHQSGTFPRRYVKEKTQEKSIYKPEKAIRPVPPPEAPRTIAPVSAPTYYEQPQAMVPVQPSYRPPMMPAPVPAQVYQPNPAQAYQPMPTQAFQPPPRRGLAKNIAGNLGNAFVFGAGATAGKLIFFPYENNVQIAHSHRGGSCKLYILSV